MDYAFFFFDVFRGGHLQPQVGQTAVKNSLIRAWTSGLPADVPSTMFRTWLGLLMPINSPNSRKLYLRFASSSRKSCPRGFTLIGCRISTIREPLSHRVKLVDMYLLTARDRPNWTENIVLYESCSHSSSWRYLFGDTRVACCQNSQQKRGFV